MNRLASFALVMFGFSGLLLANDSPIDPLRYEKEIIVGACCDPMEMEVLADGSVLFIEREGRIRLSRQIQTTSKRELVELGKIPSVMFGEVGLMGLACDLNFASNGWFYVLYCPKQLQTTLRLSRFTLVNDHVDLASEKKLLEYAIDVDGALHMGGGLWMDPRGNLHLGTGDNSLPIPEVPLDRRPGRAGLDAMRSSANSMDLRGKILRIHPNDDGSYSIPKGNLFSDPKEGRPEIYAMGCRNPFRVTVDDQDGTVFWGDVGPNIGIDLKMGPNGYDEINRAPQAGNFGWPLFVGPNEAYHFFDFATRKVGQPFDINNPINNSPNNTGIQKLPKPLPAFLWYPSGESTEWPSLGSGGRSAMAGPIYHAKRHSQSDLRLPDSLDGHLFFYEWTRNWIRTVGIDQLGKPTDLRPFMPASVFRKPLDMKLGFDGTLYVMEYGDKWSGNTDSQIVRIVYRRGNRAPHAVVKTLPAAGKQPLKVDLDAMATTDLDAGDTLTYEWRINGELLPERQSKVQTAFDKPGYYAVELTVKDAAGAKSVAATEVRVGNAPPDVRLNSPLHGSFFDWGQTIRYRVTVSDEEDGSTDDGRIESGRVLLSRQFQTRRAAATSDLGSGGNEAILDPGLLLMRKTTCFACHTTKSQSAGPPYRDVGKKYAADPASRDRLAAKIITGGAGTWGPKAMPPHPQHTIDQTKQMVNWILSLAVDGSEEPIPGNYGFFRALAPSPAGGLTPMDSGVLLLTAEYTDNGLPSVAGVLPIRSEEMCVLHTRRKRAAFFDRRHGVELVDVFERAAGLVARFGPGDWIAFKDVRLSDIDRVTWNAAALGTVRGQLSLRLDSPNGQEVTHLALRGESDQLGETFHQYTTPIVAPDGVHDLYVVAKNFEGIDPSQSAAESAKRISLSSLQFHDSPQVVERRKEDEAKVKKIALIPTKLDHAWTTHMYSDVCRLLAACLNKNLGVEAIVSPELDWPADERLLDEADAIVYYSRPAGDIVLSPTHRKKFEELLARKIGFTAIHWATGAEVPIGNEYTNILGGWFNFAHSGLKVDQRPLVQVLPDHPICHGWSQYDLRDEFYLNLKFSESAKPVLKVNVDGIDQTVAWAQERTDGGRSFGTTLGHFHDNYEQTAFRRFLVNGILWTAGIEVPTSGADVDIDRQLLTLPELPRAVVKEYKFDDLVPVLDRAIRSRSFARGEKLFQQAACAGCHRVGLIGGKMGPDLTEVRVRMARQANPRTALLREIVEPSHTVQEKYRTHVLQLASGQIVSGIVLKEADGELEIASNPNKPDEVRKVALSEIDERKTSPISMMPAGLLNTLNEDEILDLFAFVESGGQSDYMLFTAPPAKKLEPWANQDLPVLQGLQWWLDASRLNAGRKANGQAEVQNHQPVDAWFDASGYNRTADQRQDDARPRLEVLPQGPTIRFDGRNDYLTAAGKGLKSREFTALVVFRPRNNRNWPGVISANMMYRNDYMTGMNIDLMNVEKSRFETVMIEGPGWGGIINLMRESYPFGQYLLMTVVSQPGPNGVKLRINGIPQGTRDRPDPLMTFDQLTVASRFWCNDPVPAFNRGFLEGDINHVLLYDRALKDSEVVSVEKFLTDTQREFLLPARTP